MLMTAPERLILENQAEIMKALSLLMQKHGETFMARDLSATISATLTTIQYAKIFPER